MRIALFIGIALSGALPAAPTLADPCALLTPADLRSIAGSTKVSAGVATTLPAGMGSHCRYTWGTGASAAAGLWSLDINLGDAAKLYPGMGLETLKEAFAMQTKPDPANAALVSGAGEAAVYTSATPRQVNMTAYVKRQILHIGLEGPAARSKRDQGIALLKIAAGRVPRAQ